MNSDSNEKMYTLADMVSFGNYLLSQQILADRASEETNAAIMVSNANKVSNSDIDRWESQMGI